MKYYVISVTGGSYEEYFSFDIAVSTSLEKTENFIKEQERKLVAFKQFESQVQKFEKDYFKENIKSKFEDYSKWHKDFMTAKDNFISSFGSIFLTDEYQIFKNVDYIGYNEVEGI